MSKHTQVPGGFTLTELECKVFPALYRSASGNGHDFGFTDELKTPGIESWSIPGIVASLSRKGLIDIHPDHVNGKLIVQFTWGVDLDTVRAIGEALGMDTKQY